ncbi:thiamine phosphate synthase [Woodsholea maritima]|uniref:thiamine phosphate synthase n=1 Tax=Woodsholea maritima TaxID=240237 RepID=UPI00036DC0C5|nr:thiamine phosphate synthase [Woodsholea maritima]
MKTQLYLLTPPKITPDFVETLDKVLASGDVSALQIRLKDHSADEFDPLIPPLVGAARRHQVSVIINDDPHLALKYKADGVHIGQEDASYAQARRILGPKAIIGVTCHDSRHLAMLAGEQGADYVAFGAFYPTATKTPKAKASLDLLSWWTDLFEVPCVAIGGITSENVGPLVEAGADLVAVSSGVWDHPDGPLAAVAAFRAQLS